MKAYTFRRRRKIKGRLVLAKTYTARIQLDGDAVAKDYPTNITDKRVADQFMRKLIVEMERERYGITPPKKLIAGAAKPMLDHLADFTADLRARGRNRRYVRELAYRVRGMIAACGWKLLKDVTAESFLAWRKSHPKSAKTLNDYLAAISGLLEWMKVHGRSNENPLAHVGRVDGRGKQTFERAALSVEEVWRLWYVAGPRRSLYLVVIYTTLRRNAVYELRWCDATLEGDDPGLRVRASTQKDKQERWKPLPLHVAAALQKMKPADAKPTDRIFKGILPKDGLHWFWSDLDAAGIPHENGLGQRLDFHALRHTACTWGAATGIEGPTFQEFTGHATASMAARYTHREKLRTRGLVEEMPRVGDDDEWTLLGTPGGTPAGVASSRLVSEAVACGDTASEQNSRENKGFLRLVASAVASRRKVHLNAGDRNRTCTGCPTGT